ncbi:MAG TPA: hypothetical protein VN540_01110 [Clostridia bacterium]|nr:hypothetical protein [Clostridia bacterium]
MKKFWAILTVFALVLALAPTAALAATTDVTDQAGLVAALGTAASGDTVVIMNSFVWNGTTINIPAGVTVAGAPGVVISVSGGSTTFFMGAGSTVTGLAFNKTDAVTIGGIVTMTSNCTVSGCSFSGQYGTTAGFNSSHVSRGMVMHAGSANITISGCTFSHLRQPAYVEGGASGSITGNYAEFTRGWVLCNNSNFVFSGNTFSDNVVDFAIIQNAGAPGNNYAGVLTALSANNGGAYVEDQLQHASVIDGAFFVNGGAHATLAGALNAAKPGDTITVGSNYTMPAGNVTVPANVTLTISSGVLFTMNGNIANYGIIWNYGTIGGEGTIYNMGLLYTYRGYAGDVDNSEGGTTIYLDKPLYQIDIITGVGGTSNPFSPAFVTEGGSATISFAPNAGYVVGDVKVDGVSVGTVASYTFANVKANHKIEVSFMLPLGSVDLPQTGDNATLAGFVLLGLALAVAVVAGVRKVRAK